MTMKAEQKEVALTSLCRDWLFKQVSSTVWSRHVLDTWPRHGTQIKLALSVNRNGPVSNDENAYLQH